MIDVKNLKKSFGDVHVLKGITTHVNKGECICIIGPSGSGKSTFLRCLNLLEKPEEGEIIIDGQEILDPKLNVDKFRENVGMVFQHFNLFPANYAQTECQFRYCGTAIPFLTVRSTAR